uniref:Glycosyltransferase n=1 Tax=Picea sitchensis TaxID=3332 RepID=C0PPT7_PICSI|nr:unknown [Picea sitchensis]
MAHHPEPLHALLFPYPTQGHMTPMMQFAKNLASKGLTVTFVTTHHTHRQIIKARSQSDQVDPIHQDAHNLDLDIRSAQISDGLPLDFDRSAGFSDFIQAVDNMGGELERLIHNLNKTGPPISCVIVDTMLFWSLEVSKKLGIPWISFWTQPTFVYSIYYYAHLVEAQRRSHYKGSGNEGNILIDYIPGVPTLHPSDLPSFFNETDFDSQYILDLFRKSFQSSRRADWVLCNSFDDLESAEVNALMELQPPVLSVGPLLPSGYLKDESCDEEKRNGTTLLTEYDSSEWLDSKPKDSVIYVSFGSLIHVSKAQLGEIAMGLKDSGQPFLWALRPDIVASTVSDCLPDGFMDEMGSQGLVVPWCNQLQVLSHPSVAGFITHCGWNSMLEGISLGVPMLGFPFWADQFTNCKFMADEWKLGFRVSGGGHAGDNKMIDRKVISTAIRKLFTDEGKEIKKNLAALKDSARAALRGGGSSDKNMDSFVRGLKALNAKLRGKED